MIHLIEVTRETRNDDLAIEFDSLIGATIWIAQHAFDSDGYRIFAYEPANGELRSGSKAVLRTRNGNTASDVEYNTINAALAAAPMDASEPYEIFDREPNNPDGSGNGGSIFVRRRISRFQSDYETEGGYTGGGSIVASRQNDRGRTDADRF